MNGDMSRRDFVGVAAVAAGVAATALGSARFSRIDDALAAASSVQMGSEMHQVGFFVNTSKCTNCQKCVRACREHNHTPRGMASRRRVVEIESPFHSKVHASFACTHCENPACANVCPAGAISKRGDGIVTVDHNRCIGCKYCYQACPFGVPHYGENGMDKCDCCLEAGVAVGEEPWCVRACQFGALRYGDLETLMGGIARNAERVVASTDPCYLLQ